MGMTDTSYTLSLLTSHVFSIAGMPGSRKNLFMISWERTLYNPFVRKLVNESCGAFIAIQARVGKETQISVSELIQSSHQYRCIINACIEDLNQAADLAETNEATQAIQEMSEIFYKAELVWNLCEIMYLENPLGILPHLLEWVRIHFPNALEETGTVLASPTPEFHESFWKALYGLVFQLRIDSAIKLLRIHSGFQTDAFQSAFELLKKMPVFSVRTLILFRVTLNLNLKYKWRFFLFFKGEFACFGS